MQCSLFAIFALIGRSFKRKTTDTTLSKLDQIRLPAWRYRSSTGAEDARRYWGGRRHHMVRVEPSSVRMTFMSVCVRHLSIGRSTIRFRSCNTVATGFNQRAPWCDPSPGQPPARSPQPLVTPMPRTLRNLPTRAPRWLYAQARYLNNSPVRPRSRGPGPRLGTGPGPSGTHPHSASCLMPRVA